MLFRTSSRVNMIRASIGVMILLLFMMQPAHAEQANGEYTIGFNILHADQKNASIAEGYWDQPAKVFIKDGQIRVQTTINKHAWVTEFAVNQNGSMKEVKTLSVDEAADLRVTEFQVANLTDLVESEVSVYIEDIDYDHSYTMYFKFKPDTLTLVKAEEIQPPVETQEPEVTEEPTVNPQPEANKDPDPVEEPVSNAPATPAPSDTKESPAEQTANKSPEVTEEEPVTSTVGASDPQDAATEVSDTPDSSENEPAVEITEVQDEPLTEDEEVISEEADTEETSTEAASNEKNSNMGAAIIMIPIVIFVLMTVIAVIIYRKNREEA